MANKDFRAQIQLMQSGKKFPAASMVKSNPEMAAALSKLMMPMQRPQHDGKGNRDITVPSVNNFSQISQDIAEKAHDAESIMQLFPDMELSAQILISSIISPNDMGTGEVTYSIPNDLSFGEVGAPLLSIVKSYFSKDYKIEPLLPKILRQILFESGSYPMAVIPESSLDEFINGDAVISPESISEFVTTEGKPKQLNILGPAVLTPEHAKPVNSWMKFGTESMDVDNNQADIDPTIRLSSVGADPSKGATDLVNVYDNPYMLKFSQITQKRRLNAVSESIRNKGMKSFRTGRPNSLDAKKGGKDPRKINDVQMTSLVYKQRFGTPKMLRRLKTSDQTQRENVGAPMVLKLSSQSVIPVFTPGHEEQHVGYFLLVDTEGNPVSDHSTTDHFSGLQGKLNNANKNMSSYLLDKAKGAFGGLEGELDVRLQNKIFADVVEADLLARLRNGVYGQNINLGRNENVYRLMFARCNANLHTNLLYVPSDLVTYFAYRYDKQGIGKSLLDDSRILHSLRAMTLFTRVMAGIKNSIGRTSVNMKLDPDDPAPNKTIETAIDEIARTRQQYFPLGLNNPSDIVDWMGRSGYDVAFEGHPGIPDVSMNFEEKSTNYVKPDDALDEELKKRAIQSFGLAPETVDNGFNAEFATTAVQNSLLLAKRVTHIQEKVVPQLTDHARKVAMNDGALVYQLKEEVRANLEKIRALVDKDAIDADIINDDDKLITLVVSEFLSNFELGLPQPDSSSLHAQAEAFTAYETAIDNALKYYVSQEIMGQDFAGEISGKAEDMKNILKGYFMRKWMQENGFLPELNDIVSKTDDDKPTIDLLSIQDEHIAALTRAGVGLLNKTRPVANAANVDIDKITAGAGVEETSGSGFDSGASSGGGGGGGGMGGDDDFGLGGLSMGGLDMPSVDEPAGDADEEETPGGELPDLGSTT